MKKYILFFLLIITSLHAQEYVNLSVNAICSDYKNEVSKFSITINSNELNLTEDAIQDNLGGYVDIPEDRYYLKTESKVYRLKGVVEHDYETKINQFTAYITIEVFKALKDSKNLKFIQKINLELEKDKKTTTNTLNLSFDKGLLSNEHQKCKK